MGLGRAVGQKRGAARLRRAVDPVETDDRDRLERPALPMRLAADSATPLLVVTLNALPALRPPPVSDHQDIRVAAELTRQMVAEFGLVEPDDHEISDHVNGNLDGLEDSVKDG